MRNALNALVVNLEVVRSRADSMDPATAGFLLQAVQQSDETARLAEGSIALLGVVLEAVGADGTLRALHVAPNGVRIEATEAAAVRAARSLSSLAARVPLIAEAEGAAVILSISGNARKPQSDA